MPRGRRLAFDNAIFHVFNRGNARQDIFHDDEDFEKFLQILARYKNKFGFKMYHFILMPNHHHFEWEIPYAYVLSKAMQGIALSYSRYYHAKYKTVGYFWQGRFKNMIVESEKYLMRLGAYIEGNAKRAGLVKELGDWKWSSYRFYAYGESMQISLVEKGGVKKPVELVDCDPFYNRFSDNAEGRQKNYREFAFNIINNQEKEKSFNFQDGGVSGSEQFKREMAMTMKSEGMLIKSKKRGRPPKF